MLLTSGVVLFALQKFSPNPIISETSYISPLKSLIDDSNKLQGIAGGMAECPRLSILDIHDKAVSLKDSIATFKNVTLPSEKIDQSRYVATASLIASESSSTKKILIKYATESAKSCDNCLNLITNYSMTEPSLASVLSQYDYINIINI